MAGTVDDPSWGPRWVKRALLLIIVGLVVQLFCLYAITPGTFLLFAGGGVGLVLLGLGMFAWASVRAHRAFGGQTTTGGGEHD